MSHAYNQRMISRQRIFHLRHEKKKIDLLYYWNDEMQKNPLLELFHWYDTVHLYRIHIHFEKDRVGVIKIPMLF